MPRDSQWSLKYSFACIHESHTAKKLSLQIWLSYSYSSVPDLSHCWKIQIWKPIYFNFFPKTSLQSNITAYKKLKTRDAASPFELTMRDRQYHPTERLSLRRALQLNFTPNAYYFHSGTEENFWSNAKSCHVGRLLCKRSYVLQDLKYLFNRHRQ